MHFDLVYTELSLTTLEIGSMRKAPIIFYEPVVMPAKVG